MGKIIRNGIKYSGTTNSADKINYNNTLSGLEAETAQEAFDELNTKIKNGGSNIKYLTQEEYDALPESKLTDGIEYRITDANTDSTKARNIAYDNAASGIEATSVQGAIDSVNERLVEKFETLQKYVVPNSNNKVYVCKLGKLLFVGGTIESATVKGWTTLLTVTDSNFIPSQECSGVAVDSTGRGFQIVFNANGEITTYASSSGVTMSYGNISLIAFQN